jgi:hypothetical protein
LNSGSTGKVNARDAYLDTLPEAEQVRVLRQSEKVGPLSTDPDWLVAYAADRAAARIEAAVAALEVRTASPNKKSGGEAGRAGRNRGPLRELSAFALALVTFAGVAWGVDASSTRVQSIAVYTVAIAFGVAVSALYIWAAPKIHR